MKKYTVEFYADQDGREPANGFIKKVSKTPKAEIERAKKCKLEYERMNGNDKL